MATYIKGNAVENATSYELLEKSGSIYTPIATGNEINFNLDDLSLAGGSHTLVVKAKADGYEDSDYSNEVVYDNTGESLDITNTATIVSGKATSAAGEYLTSSFFNTMEIDVSAYAGKGKKLDFTFITYTGSDGTQSKNSCGFVDTSDNFILVKTADLCGLGSKKGEKVMLTNIEIPAGAVTFRTTWFSEGAITGGVYSGSVSDFNISVR